MTTNYMLKVKKLYYLFVIKWKYGNIRKIMTYAHVWYSNVYLSPFLYFLSFSSILFGLFVGWVNLDMFLFKSKIDSSSNVKVCSFFIDVWFLYMIMLYLFFVCDAFFFFRFLFFISWYYVYQKKNSWYYYWWL